jgi:hypothetical protein
MPRKAIAVLMALVAMSLTLGVTGTASAKKKDGKRADTFIENDCKRLAQKPRHIELNCGKKKSRQDDTELRKVRYRNKQYGKNNVRARANLHIKGVTNGRTQVKLRFKNLKKCAGKHANGKADNKSEVYRKVTIRYKNGNDVPAGSKRRWNKKLGCG